MKETTRTDWRKFRKSTHLASTDLDIMKSEGKKLVFTIKEIKHEKGVNVSGTKTDGFFCYFEEPIKPMKINNTNLLILAGFLKENGIDVKDIYIVELYKNLTIELYVDNSVKFMGEFVDGIRIRPAQPRTEKPVLTKDHKRFADAKKAFAEGKGQNVLDRFEISDEVLELLTS